MDINGIRNCALAGFGIGGYFGFFETYLRDILKRGDLVYKLFSEEDYKTKLLDIEKRWGERVSTLPLVAGAIPIFASMLSLNFSNLPEKAVLSMPLAYLGAFIGVGASNLLSYRKRKILREVESNPERALDYLSKRQKFNLEKAISSVGEMGLTLDYKDEDIPRIPFIAMPYFNKRIMELRERKYVVAKSKEFFETAPDNSALTIFFSRSDHLNVYENNSLEFRVLGGSMRIIDSTKYSDGVSGKIEAKISKTEILGNPDYGNLAERIIHNMENNETVMLLKSSKDLTKKECLGLILASYFGYLNSREEAREQVAKTAYMWN